MNRDQIVHRLRELKPQLQSEFNVSQIGLFGSFARGDNTCTSDLDVLVDFSETISLFRMVSLKDLLSTRLHRKKLDLVPLKMLRPELKDAIMRDLIEI